MINADAILAGLGRITNEAFIFAVLWHVLVGAALILLWLGWRPAPRLAGGLLCLPLVSASAFAWAFGNPFNGSMLAVTAIVLGWLTWRAPKSEVRHSRWWSTILGGLLVAFAWSYPHFLAGRPTLTYLVGAPMGLIPCPTLSLVIGAALIGYGPHMKGWALVLAGAGAFYALFGVLRLGVLIDVALLVGSLGLWLRAWTRRQAPAAATSVGHETPRMRRVIGRVGRVHAHELWRPTVAPVEVAAAPTEDDALTAPGYACPGSRAASSPTAVRSTIANLDRAGDGWPAVALRLDAVDLAYSIRRGHRVRGALAAVLAEA